MGFNWLNGFFLGKVVPVVGKEVFSYLLYARDPHMSSDEIHRKVNVDAAFSVFDLEGKYSFTL